MKLAKKISKGIALCAALTIMGTMGGVLASCSNGSDEEYQPNIKTISNVDDVTFTVTTASVGEENTNIVFTYDRSANGAKEKITIKDCNIEVLFNGEKITTINKLDFALNEYDNFVGDNATQYQCKISIGKKVSPGDTVKVVFKSKTGDVSGEGANSAQIDKLTVSLIDNDEKAGQNGWYNELVDKENEYRPLFPKEEDSANPADKDKDKEEQKPVESKPEDKAPAEDDKKDEGKNPPPVDDEKDKDKEDTDKDDPDSEDPPAKEGTVLYTLDFSGEALPENDYDGIKDSQGAVEFKAKEGLSITGGWKSFGIVPKGISEKDFSTANYIKVTFKCSEGATFEKENNRLMVAVYNTNEKYADTNFSWTAFFDKGNDGDIPTEFKTVEKEINWELKYDENGKSLPLADTSKINGIRIWTQAFTGTLIVQSIEFIKK